MHTTHCSLVQDPFYMRALALRIVNLGADSMQIGIQGTKLQITYKITQANTGSFRMQVSKILCIEFYCIHIQNPLYSQSDRATVIKFIQLTTICCMHNQHR